jgi:hypothetical protein
VTHLVRWLKAAQEPEAGNDPLAREYAGSRESVCLPAAADAIIRRYKPIADIASEFYRSLHKDKLTSYPADEIERACAKAGLPEDEQPSAIPGEGQGG